MDLNQQKELFSKAYVRAVASTAGYSVDQPETDYDSVDLRISARGSRGTVRSPQLELQLKCTSTSINLLVDSYIRYPLNLKNYNDLRMDDFAVPRILVVVLVPDNLQDWLQQSEEKLSMKHCGYWVSLLGEPERHNKTTVTVYLPRSHQFTVEALRSIMQLIGQGGTP